MLCPQIPLVPDAIWRMVMGRRWSLLASFGLVWLAAGASAQRNQAVVDAASPVTVVTRESLEAAGQPNLSLLIDLAPATGRIDEVRVKLPSDKTLQTRYIAPGWSVEQDGKQLRAHGPDRAGLSARLGVAGGRDRDYVGKKTDVEWLLDGRLVSQSTLTIGQAPGVFVSPNLEGILTLPAEVTYGQPFIAGTGEAYRRGTWRITVTGASGTRDLPLVPFSRFKVDDDNPPVPADRIFIQDLAGRPQLQNFGTYVPRDFDPLVSVLGEGRMTRVSYVDHFNEKLIDAPVDIPVVEAPASCPLALTAGTPFAFAGQAACARGCFTDYGAAYGLMLDGNIPIKPWALSPTTAMFGIPADTPAGPHTIEVPGGSSRITVGVLTVEGSIDQNKLWKGETTTLRLRVIGTDTPLPLVVVNRTPGIIDVQGGHAQTVTTAGGADNAVTRSVQGIFRGNFQITYSLNVPGCK
jgi:hypothetical protein